MYMTYDSTTPASASQNGSEAKACRRHAHGAAGSWNSLASSSIAGCFSVLKKIALPKKLPYSIGLIVRKPMTADGIASSTSGSVTTHGDSCGSWSRGRGRRGRGRARGRRARARACAAAWRVRVVRGMAVAVRVVLLQRRAPGSSASGGNGLSRKRSLPWKTRKNMRNE